MKSTFLKFVLTPLLFLGLIGSSFAATAVNTGKITPSYQKSYGGLNTNGLQTLSTGSTVITGINVTSGATANQVQLWDASTNNANVIGGTSQTAGNASTCLEVGTAANTSTFFDFSNTPIRTVNGLEASGGGSAGSSYIVYTVQYP